MNGPCNYEARLAVSYPLLSLESSDLNIEFKVVKSRNRVDETDVRGLSNIYSGI